ncbi:MAG: hypothetical protein MUF81_00070 [Verrucomicrobia bacterium]|jgi:hypothetical protein|nr:hypothetical protein [Verrucomicrobiota bacterium]
MSPFIHRFPELGTRETRTITTAGVADLPADDYALLELYCDELDCDCRRVMIEVVARSTGDTLTIINYGWEGLEFYKRKLGLEEYAREVMEASLDPLNPQSRHSPILLNLFRDVVKDQAYKERLARHYWMFKDALRRKAR